MDSRQVQELMGHKDVRTTMIDTHVMARGPGAVRSPLDRPACQFGPPIAQPAVAPVPVADQSEAWVIASAVLRAMFGR